jgi:hypothetical protein
LDVVKKFLECVVQYDMKTPLQVPVVYYHDISLRRSSNICHLHGRKFRYECKYF